MPKYIPATCGGFAVPVCKHPMSITWGIRFQKLRRPASELQTSVLQMGLLTSFWLKTTGHYVLPITISWFEICSVHKVISSRNYGQFPGFEPHSFQWWCPSFVLQTENFVKSSKQDEELHNLLKNGYASADERGFPGQRSRRKLGRWSVVDKTGQVKICCWWNWVSEDLLLIKLGKWS